MKRVRPAVLVHIGPMLAWALLALTRGLDVRGELDRLLHKHLGHRDL